MKKFLTTLILSVAAITSFAGSEFTGKVVDANKQAVTGARVEIVGTDYVFYTDFDGNFDLSKLPEGTYTLKISFVSYKEVVLENIKLTEDKQQNLRPVVLR